MSGQAHLLAEVARLQAELQQSQSDLAVEKQRHLKTRQENACGELYYSALSWLIAQGSGSKEAVFKNICIALTKCSQWDTVLVIDLLKNTIDAAAGATQRQKETIMELVSKQSYLREHARQGTVFSSYSGSQKEGLVLRALFQGDEIIGVPLLKTTRSIQYVFVCTHREHTKHYSGEEKKLAAFCTTLNSYIQDLE